MEKGTLIILQTKKGFAAKISYLKHSGKPGELPAVSYRPDDDSYNGTDCTFLREGGQLVKLVAHDGKVLFDASQLPSSLSGKGPKQPNKGNNWQQPDSIPDSFSPDDTFLPKDTREALLHLDSPPDSFALKLNKAARFDERMGKFQFFKRDRKGENYEIRANYADFKFLEIADRSLNDAKRFLSASNIRSFDLELDWRLVQGLGIESVYETSINLHHVYGSPFIPGSSFKGMVRSWIITEVFGHPETTGAEKDFPLINAEFRAITQSKEFCELFGCPAEAKPVLFNHGKPVFKKAGSGKESKQYEFGKPSSAMLKNEEGKGVAHKGNLIFFDAFPLSAPSIEVDVMNPHYGPYYSDPRAETPPADYHNPVPVPFLTASNTRFRFIVGAYENEYLNRTIGGKTIDQWLRSALTSHGIGAKTAVGYGFFREK